jgi:hypothetical protein
MPQVDARLAEAQVAYFDDLERLTLKPDEHFAAIRSRYSADVGLRVPERIFNAVRGQMEDL